MEKRNYQREMEAEIARLEGRRPTLLLHSCCGPCSSAVLERLTEHFRVTLLYYNPNIEPEAEYLHRLNEQKRREVNAQALKDARLPRFSGDISGYAGTLHHSDSRNKFDATESLLSMGLTGAVPLYTGGRLSSQIKAGRYSLLAAAEDVRTAEKNGIEEKENPVKEPRPANLYMMNEAEEQAWQTMVDCRLGRQDGEKNCFTGLTGESV